MHIRRKSKQLADSFGKYGLSLDNDVCFFLPKKIMFVSLILLLILSFSPLWRMLVYVFAK